MKVSFKSVRECLDSLEFCPICGSRSKIDLIAYDDRTSLYITSVTSVGNKELSVSRVVTKDVVFVVDLDNNQIITNKICKKYPPEIRLRCSKMHFGWSYHMKEVNGHVELDSHTLHFMVVDKKYCKRYSVNSTYDTNSTTISINDGITAIDTFKQPLIHFSDLASKDIVKKLRVISLLH